MQRLPIRIRLTLAFALAAALVLLATGVLVYFRVRAEIDRSEITALETRAADLATLVRQAGPADAGAGVHVLRGSSESSAQVLDPSGQVLDSTPSLARVRLLSAGQLRRASERALNVERSQVPTLEGYLRVFATPIDVDGRTLVVAVGMSLEDRDDALAGLRSQLLLGLPLAFLLTTLGAYLLSGAALRPVGELRRSAEGVTRSGPGVRLAVPVADDEIADLATTLNAMLGRIDAAAQRERQFVADASHELRSPLTMLKGEIELALRPNRTPREHVEALRAAAIEVDGLAQLSDDLLSFARADQGDLPLRLTRTDARELLTAVARRFSSRAQRAGRALEIDAPDGLMLDVDAPRITQALCNLVENALRHGAGTITLCACETPTATELGVVDQGSGVTPAFAERAFERFSRADPARSGAGAGLGLAIVELIARSHGGTALIRQQSGRFEVAVDLPRSGAVGSASHGLSV